MRRTRLTRGTGVALAAALVLFVQSFLTAWAAGAMPYGLQLDAFGNPLCITSIDQPDTGHSNDHSGLPSCCTLGCSMASPLLPVPDSTAFGVTPVAIAGALPEQGQPVFLPAPDHDPGSPRAPPLTA